MHIFFDGYRAMTLDSIFIRLLVAVICGGVVGLEREYKRRPAGFRTHILICLGAAMTTLTSQYLMLKMNYYTDVTRLGAQVVAGIGFIGAGTIIVTGRQRVKGLTTAAGLWSSAIMGLAIGSGFFEGGLLVTALVLLAEVVFSKLEYFILKNTLDVNLYLEYREKPCLDQVLRLFRELNVKVLNLEITRLDKYENNSFCAIIALRLHKKVKLESLIPRIASIDEDILVKEF